MESENLHPLIRKNIFPIILGIIGITLIIIGIFQVYLKKPNASPVVFTQDKEDVVVEVVVDVEGAVITPGVYKIKSDSRVVDALAKAGGLAEDADRDWVEKNINLASRVTDGLKIYIPRAGEEVLSDNTNSSIDIGTTGPVLNINSASASDLETLPGVGEVTAQKIIDGRPYSNIEDLLKSKTVGRATYEKIREKISAN